MTSIDDARNDVINVPGDLEQMELDQMALDELDAVPGDTDALALDPLNDSSSGDRDMEDTYTEQELKRLRAQISKRPPQRPRKRPMPQRKRKQKTTPQRKKNKESAKRRRDDMSRYNTFLIKNNMSKETTIAAIRIKLKQLADDGKKGAQKELDHLNANHPRRFNLRF